MKLILTILLFSIGLMTYCQNTDGLWYNEEGHYFLSINEDHCILASSWHDYQDTIRCYGSFLEFKIRSKSNRFNLSRSYRSCLPFFKGSERNRYEILELTARLLVLKPHKRHEEQDDPLGVVSERNSFTFRKVEAEFVIENNNK